MPSPQSAAAADLFDPPATRPGRARMRPTALPWPAILLFAVGVAILLWGTWVTKGLLGQGVDRPAFASVRLQPLVAEYVEAQARTQSPEEQVTRETRAFMARLDAELQSRGRAGTTVLVAEAVLSKDIPDITDAVRRAVHADVPLPSPAAGGVSGASR